MTERLDKILSNQLNISRSDSRRLIKIGQVSVNGEVVRSFGFQIDPQKDKVLAEGKSVEYRKHLYIMLNKPKGVLSATEDKKQTTVIDLLPDGFKRKNMSPVGRLDKDTTGLLIITDDGEFSHNVISPKKEITKLYIAEVDNKIPLDAKKKFQDGIVLADGTRCLSARLEILSNDNPYTCKIEIKEGKYHQIKRMLGVVGLGVKELKRVSIGGLSLDDSLKDGECREMTEKEKNLVFV